MTKRDLIRRNIETVNEKVEIQTSKIKKSSNFVAIMAVSKTASVEEIALAYQEGMGIFGESYAQEAIPKMELLFSKHGLSKDMFHFIGHVQSNKVPKILQHFGSVDSVDSIDIVEKINRKSCQIDLKTPVYLEVNTTGEPSKFGFDSENVLHFMDKVVFFNYIEVVGFMTMGPLNGKEKDVRRSFSSLRSIRDKIEQRFGLQGMLLSMGMSNDFEWAIQEGSNVIRIGKGIFGEESIKE